MPDLDAIVLTHQPVVLKTAYRLLGRSEDARDAAQEVFLKWFRNRTHVNGDIGAWLYRVTVNVCNDHFRQRRPTVQLCENRPDSVPGPESQMRTKEQRGLLRSALNILTERERATILLRHVDGYSCDETAAILNVTSETVRSRAHSARAKMATRLRRRR